MTALTALGDLAVETSREGSTVTVHVRGDLDPATAPLLRAVLDGVWAARPERVHLDLSGVSYLDYSVLATLVAARRRLAANEAVLAVRRPSSFADRVLRMSGLHRVLDVA